MEKVPPMMISLKDIYIKEGRARKDFDPKKLLELADSLKQYGMAQPVVVTNETIDGVEHMVLVAGERRCRAAAIAELSEIPCVWKDSLSETEQKCIELEENVQRQNFSWQEQMDLMEQITTLRQAIHGAGGPGTRGEGWSIKDTAKIVGADPSYVASQIQMSKLLKARPDLRQEVTKKGMSQGAAKSYIKAKMRQEEAAEQVKNGLVKITAGFENLDCREFLHKQPDNSIDAFVTDLPYGIPDLEQSRGDTQNFSKFLTDNDNLDSERAIQLVKDIAKDLFRTLKPGRSSWLFFGWDIYQEMIQTLRGVGFTVNQVPVIWNKGEMTAPFRGYVPAPCYEQILLVQKPDKDGNLYRMPNPMSGILNYKPVSRILRTHPFQKPKELLEFLISQVSAKGEVICDFCAGSGSTLVTALQIGRSTIGCELNPGHYVVAQLAIKTELDEQAKGQ